jgi:small-conductance mechanosensitive channel
MAWAKLVELTVGVILVMAAASKAARLSSFATALSSYRLVPSGKARALAPVAVGVEAVVGFLLLTQHLAAWTLAGAGLLFVTFVVVGVIEVLHADGAEPRADCGCLGGVVRLRVGRATIAINVLIAGACFSSAAAFVLTDPDAASAQLARVASGAVWVAAISLAALYWLSSYAVSVIAVMRESRGIPSVSGR